MSKTIPEQLAEAIEQMNGLKGQLADLTTKANASEKGLADATATIAALNTEKANLTQALEAARAEITTQKATITQLQSEAKSADQRATQIAANAGVPPVTSEKKGGEDATATETLEQVRAQINATRDPVLRSKLAAKAAALRASAK